LEYWKIGISEHHSIIPPFHYSRFHFSTIHPSNIPFFEILIRLTPETRLLITVYWLLVTDRLPAPSTAASSSTSSAATATTAATTAATAPGTSAPTKAASARASTLARAARWATAAIDPFEGAAATAATAELTRAGTITGSTSAAQTTSASVTRPALSARATAITNAGAIAYAAAPEILSSLLGATAKLLSRLNRVIGARSVKFLRRSLVTIAHPFAIFGIMLPFALTLLIDLPPVL
jgi:hypothetical protein